MSVKLSVIMSTYNRENMVLESVNSILTQTYDNFEFIIIDDNSTDNTYNLIKSLNDKRIKLFRSNRNCGCTFNYHTGQNIAKGEFIAHIDDDDISFPKRLETQINYMENNCDIVLAGTFIETFGENMRPSWVFYSDSEKINFSSNFYNPLCHSSIIYRKSFMEKNNINYDINKKCAQDYDFYKQILLKGGKISNLEEILVKYRMHKNRLTDIKQTQDIQIYNAENIKRELQARYLKPNQIEEFNSLIADFPFNNYNVNRVITAMKMLKDAIMSKNEYNSNKIDEVIKDIENLRFKF